MCEVVVVSKAVCDDKSENQFKDILQVGPLVHKSVIRPGEMVNT